MSEMMEQFLTQIDWQRPWLEALRSIADPILQASDWIVALNAASAAQPLCNHQGLPIRFVPQSELPDGMPYEAFISATGKVPTRNNLHDFFNGLIWLTFPKVKARLNALQASEIIKAESTAQAGAAGTRIRGKVRDAATIFDENAAIFLTRDQELVDALCAHRWLDVFMARPAVFERDCDVHLFGHALMEKLVAPYKAITAHAWVVVVDDAYFMMPNQYRRAWIDHLLAEQLACGLATSDFTPLPILGVPGWAQQQDAAFYADVSVFRPKRGHRLC